MAFQVKIKNSDGSVDTSKYASGIIDRWKAFSVGFGIVGGCLGCSLPISRNFRDNFDFTLNQIIEISWNGTLFYSGFISGEIKKDVTNNEHNYSVRGYWDKLSNTVLDEEIVLGALSTSNPTINTIGKVINYIADKIVVAGVGVNKNSSKIVCSTPIDEITIHKEADIFGLLQQLRVMAASDGNTYAVGVDAAKDFFFLPVSNLNVNVQGTLNVGGNVQGATELPSSVAPINHTVIVADKVPTRGLWSKKTYRFASAVTAKTIGKPYYIRLAHIYRESDLNRFNTGFSNVWANPAPAICDLSYKPSQTDPIACPWAGQFKYVDGIRGITIQDFAPTLEVSVGAFLSYKVNIGLTAAAASDSLSNIIAGSSDKFTPTAIDKYLSPKEQDDLSVLPDVTDVTAPPSGYPCEMGPSIPLTGSNIESLGGGSGSGTTIAKGQVLDLLASGGGRVGDIIRFQCLVGNGGTNFDVNSAPVKFHWKLMSNTGTVIETAYHNAINVSQSGSVEVWASPAAGYVPAQEGFLYYCVEVVTQTSPAQSTWYPCDFSSGTEYQKCPDVRIFDLSGSATYIYNNTFPAGWWNNTA